MKRHVYVCYGVANYINAERAMTGPNTSSDPNDKAAAGSPAGGDATNAGAGAPGSASAAGGASSSSSSSTRTTTTEEKKVDRSSVSDGVKYATGQEGQDSPADGVSLADGGARQRDEDRRRERR